MILLKKVGIFKNISTVVITGGRHQFFREIHIRAKLCRTQEINFEKRCVKITAGYKKYLEILYGADYMNPSPAEKRKNIFYWN